MPYIFKKLLIVLSVSIGLAVVFSVSTFATGEKYTWANSGKTKITASGGAYATSSNNMSGNFSYAGSNTGDSNVIELRNTNSTAVAGAEQGKCTVSILIDKGANKVYPTLLSCTNNDGYIDNNKANGITLSNEVSVGAYVNTQQVAEVDTARSDAVYAAMGPSLEPLKSKFNSSCSGMPNEAACHESTWKNAIYTCFQSSLSLEEDQTRGSAEQTEQNHKAKFSRCLAARLTNVDASGVNSLLGAVSISGTNTAANTAGNTVEQAQAANSEDTEDDEDATSCGIEGMGWIICPALTFLGTVSDGAFGFLSSTFLETPSNYFTGNAGQPNPVRDAWGAMRSIANVAFVIAFVIIIYSQLTSSGIGSYGVKKLLPRLIVAAILVNLSFIICQLAVDLSNLLGYSLKVLFSDGLASISSSAPSGDQAADAIMGGLGWGVLIAGLVAGGITVALSVSIPVLLAALLAVLLIVLILVARTALIILLTIISPLAFVAFLLPNTEQWFKKWYKMFFALLMVFPIIGVVFGASSLAGKVIYDAAAGDMLMQLVGLGAATIPLFLVPSLLKNSLSAAGAIGGKLAGLSSKANGRVGSKAKTQLGNSRLGEAQRGLKNRFALSKAARRSKAGGWQQRLDNSRLGRAVGLDRGAAVALSTVNRAENEEVEQEMVRMRAGTDPREMINKAATELQSANSRGDVVAARAAQKILLGSGNKGVAKLHETLHGLEAGGSLKEDVSKELRADLNGAGLKGKDNALASWAYSNGATIAGQEASASTYSSLSPTELAGQSAAALTQGSYGGITPSMAEAALSNPAAASQLDEEKRTILQSIVDSGGTSGTQQTTDTTTPHPEQNITPNPQATTTTATPTQAPSVLVQPTAQEVRQFGGSSGELVEGQTFSVIDKRSSASRSQPEPAPARKEGEPKVTDKRAGGGVDSWLK